MGSRHQILWYIPTDQFQISLRRYVAGVCPGPAKTYHNAEVKIAVETRSDYKYYGFGDLPRDPYPKHHPQWPTKCEHCDYAFTNEDEWQISGDRIFICEDTGESYPHRRLPPGAVFDSTWWHGEFGDVGPDGRSLTVITPGGEWCPDSMASNGTGRWMRTGRPEDGSLDIKPSILIGTKYHGFVNRGWLEEC